MLCHINRFTTVLVFMRQKMFTHYKLVTELTHPVQTHIYLTNGQEYNFVTFADDRLIYTLQLLEGIRQTT